MFYQKQEYRDNIPNACVSKLETKSSNMVWFAPSEKTKKIGARGQEDHFQTVYISSRMFQISKLSSLLSI